MTSRVSLAAAAAMVASGLLVAGSSMSLAFAEPDKPSAGDAGGAGSPGASDPAPGQSADPQPAIPGGGSADSGSPAKGGTVGGPQQPQSHVGHGRTGEPTGTKDRTPDPKPSSKQPEPSAEAAPQTPSANPGEVSPKPTENPPAAGAEDPQDQQDPQAEEQQQDAGSGSGSEPPKTEVAAAPVVTAPVVTDPEVTPPTEPQGPGDETPVPEADPAGTREGIKEGEGEEEPQEPDWCWWPLPTFPTLPDIGGGNAVPQTFPQIPVGDLLKIPQMQIPQIEAQLAQLQQIQIPLLPPDLIAQLTQPVQPFIDAVSGLATAASELPFTTITLPVIVTPGGAAGGSGGGGGAGTGGVGTAGIGPRPGMPESPRITGKPGGKPASPPEPTQSSPDNVPAYTAGAGAAPAPSYRAGYADYLRAAGLGEVAAVAVPGVTGILALVGAGGLLGYRQARAGHTVRASGTGRFMS